MLSTVLRSIFKKTKTLYIQQLFFEIEVNIGRLYTEPQSGDVNIRKATNHRD